MCACRGGGGKLGSILILKGGRGTCRPRGGVHGGEGACAASHMVLGLPANVCHFHPPFPSLNMSYEYSLCVGSANGT